MRAWKDRWVTHAILGAGVALRLALAIATPPERAYDNHFEPVDIILEKGWIPSASDCWECFQPPLYYLVSAGAFGLTEQVGLLTGASSESAAAAGRKAIQFVSVLAGAATLYVCLLILRQQCKPAPWREALALAFIAFLPRHIYMSAMVTNDALTYLLASLAVYATLRAHRRDWDVRSCLLTGALAGATILCKGYGLMSAGAILACVIFFALRATRGIAAAAGRPGLKPAVLILSATLAIGIWPTVRNVRTYERLHIDNYAFFSSPMHTQPPGSVAATEFLSFRFGALLRRPWLHISHADSFWTELYGRLWFDYEGFSTSLAAYPPWQKHAEELRVRWETNRAGQKQWPQQRWNSLLDYGDEHVPPMLRPVAVASYIAGLPLTICVLAGLVVSLRRFGREFATTLLLTSFLLAAIVPVFQTLRLPHFAAMKAAFLLCGLSSVPTFVCAFLASLRPAMVRFIVPLLWLGLAAVGLADAAYVAVRFIEG